MLSSVSAKGNTVGSRSKTNLAYIAGFLDGDGSLMLQLKKRSDSKYGRRFMCTICFYQDSRHEEPLRWIQQCLGIGYLSQRNDGMSELRINGYKQVRDILSSLLPYIRFKHAQAVALLAATDILASKRLNEMSDKDLDMLIEHIVELQSHNYVTKKKKTREELLLVLGLTP